MNWHKWVDLASVLTFAITAIGAVIGVFGYLGYLLGIRKKSKRLEQYLRAEKQKGENKGQRSVLRIIRDVGLTEDEIIQASFRNHKIRRRIIPDEKGIADQLMFEYEE